MYQILWTAIYLCYITLSSSAAIPFGQVLDSEISIFENMFLL